MSDRVEFLRRQDITKIEGRVKMTFEAFWLLVVKIVTPLVIAYNAWLHNKLTRLEDTASADRRVFYDFKADVAANYVAKDALREMESRITNQITRIDAKLDRLIEKDAG